MSEPNELDKYIQRLKTRYAEEFREDRRPLLQNSLSEFDKIAATPKIVDALDRVIHKYELILRLLEKMKNANRTL